MYALCRDRNERAGRARDPRLGAREAAVSAELRPDQQRHRLAARRTTCSTRSSRATSRSDHSVAELVDGGLRRRARCGAWRGWSTATSTSAGRPPPGVRVSPKAFGKDRRLADHQPLARVAPRPDPGETVRRRGRGWCRPRCLFGVTFPLVHDALGDIQPFAYLLLRFTIAVVVLGPFAGPGRPPPPGGPAPARPGRAGRRAVPRRRLRGPDGGPQRAIAPSTSAFITGLYVVFTPLVEGVVRRRLPRAARPGGRRGRRGRPLPPDRRHRRPRGRRAGHAGLRRAVRGLDRLPGRVRQPAPSHLLHDRADDRDRGDLRARHRRPGRRAPHRPGRVRRRVHRGGLLGGRPVPPGVRAAPPGAEPRRADPVARAGLRRDRRLRHRGDLRHPQAGRRGGDPGRDRPRRADRPRAPRRPRTPSSNPGPSEPAGP